MEQVGSRHTNESRYKKAIAVATAAGALALALSACGNAAAKHSTLPSATTTAPAEKPAPSTTEAPSTIPTTTTTEAPTTTTTLPFGVMPPSEVPAIVTTAEQRYPGQEVLVLPALCNEMIVIKPIPIPDLVIVGDGPTGTAIDNLIPDVSPQPDCPATLDHAAAVTASGHPYDTRGQRTNPDYLGTANRWEPIAGQWPNGTAPGQPLTFGYPGELGNDVIFGHRTTESSPFSSIDQLTTGDDEYFAVPNGNGYNVYHYRVLAPARTYPADDKSDVLLFGYNSNGQPTGQYYDTLFACGPNQRDNSARVVVRGELVP